ncbi:MAG: GNAT family N-acetyltransferase [Candidatus Eisenbacteria bacterium]
MSAFKIVPLEDQYRMWAKKLIEDNWGSTKIVTRGKVHDTAELPGFVGIWRHGPAGLVTYRIDGDQCEITSLDSIVEGVGIATALIDAVREVAIEKKCKRLWLITTNDNQAAVDFYQGRGFEVAAVHKDALVETRRLKPELPQTGIDGIPLKDEIELQSTL